MIFEEVKDGAIIHIPHEEMMKEDVVGFILTILHGREMYQGFHNANMDDDDTDGE